MCWTCDKEAPTKPCRGCGVNLPDRFDRCPKCNCPTKFLNDRVCWNCNQPLEPGTHHIVNPHRGGCWILTHLAWMTNEPIKFTDS